MMHWIQNTFQEYPEIAIFLALSIGFYAGKIRIAGFSLGTVTCVLLAGMLVGQLHVTISSHVQAVFFVLFIFAVGYSAGPRFFSSLKKEGKSQILFALAMCALSIGTVALIALIMGYNKGQTAGLFAGSQTVSPIIGIASDTIARLTNINDATKKEMTDAIPICYAITYIFGTAGASWLLAVLGPRLLGGIEQVKAECRTLEDKLGGTGQSHKKITPVTTTFNAYRISEQSIAHNKTIRQLEEEFVKRNRRLFIRRIRRGDTIYEATPEQVMQDGDIIVVNGRRSFLLPETELGTEVIDDELLNFPISTVPVNAINKESVGLSLKELALKDYMYGVIVQSITRSGIKIPMYIEVPIEKGDQLELVGLKKDVDRAISRVGYAEVSTEKTNMAFVGAGIVLGGLIGAITFHFGSIPFSLGSTGALLSGLFFGWLRVQKPAFGKIPEAAGWLMDNVGLTVFVAIVGINAGRGFVSGVREMGISIFVAGIVASAIPIFGGLLMGRYVFKLHPAYTLGCIAGSTATASLSAIQDSLESELPTLAYTITYTINNISLIVGGTLLVLLL